MGWRPWGREGAVQQGLRLVGGVIAVVSEASAADAAASFFCQALDSSGMTPCRVTMDKAAAYPPALAAVLPGVELTAIKML